MNRNEKSLFKFCKTGDLSNLKQLIEKEDVDLNIRDKWDSTPLYYACLCGHLEIVEFLLGNGSICEANTFDGERCLYGALTNQIKNVLKNFKINTTKLDEYNLHLERLFELGANSDIAFEVKGRVFKAHKFILCARSEYFRNKFENKWKYRTWIIGENEHIETEAFGSILKYLYTGRFSTLKMYFKNCLRLAKLFKLYDLIEKFNKELFILNVIDDNVKFVKFDVNIKDFDDGRLVHETDIFIIGKFGVNSKLSLSISISSHDQIKNDFKNLAYFCLPENLRKNFEIKSKNEMIDLNKTVQFTHDMNLILENDFNFYLHKAFMSERCDYFKAFLNDPFNELEIKNEKISNLKNITNINLKEISKEVFIEIISFIYSDEFSNSKLDENLLHEVLIFADLYLLTSLKRKCASQLSNLLSNENIFEMLKMSRLYQLKKLEFSCINYLAINLFNFESSVQLRDMIIEDAKSLKQRQETDTIDIIDNLRYAIHENSSLYELIDLKNKLNLLDKILNELNLVC